jgi:parallel beta-helix repeat protein
MARKPVLVFIVIMLFLAGFSPLCPTASGDLTDPTALTDHSAISIKSNSEFNTSNGVVAGIGTKTNPYIIENWTLSSNKSTALHIEYTDAYFIIRNCYLVGQADHLNKAGIALYHTKNGLITHNRFEQHNYGINLGYATLLLVTMNLFVNNTIGIWEESGDNNVTLLDNDFTGNLAGIHLAHSSYTHAVGNTISGSGQGYGIWIDDAMNVTLYSNKMYGNENDFSISSIGSCCYGHTIPQNNTVGGKPMIYWRDVKDKSVPTGAGFVGLIGSSNIKVENLTLLNVSPAVLIAGKSQNISVRNDLLYNGSAGIFIDDSNTIAVSNVTFHNSTFGVEARTNPSWLNIYKNKMNGVDNAVKITGGSSVRLTNNSINNSWLDTTIISGVTDLTITDNNITNVTFGYGFKLSTSNNVMFQRNYMTGMSRGLEITGGANTVKVLDNLIEGTKTSGIQVDGTDSDILMRNNTFNNNPGDAIDVEGHVSNLRILDNRIVNNTWWGIVTHSDASLVQDNAVQSGMGGIAIVGNDITVRNNTVQNATFGLGIYTSKNAKLFSNRIVGNQYGVECRGWPTASTALLYDNLFKDNLQHVGILDTGCTLTWYVNKQAGPNIIGGPYIGGNFWDNYTGQDQDGDFLGDTNVPFWPGDLHPLIPAAPILEDKTNDTAFTGKPFHVQFVVTNDWGTSSGKVDTWQDLKSHFVYTPLVTGKDGNRTFFAADIDIDTNSANLSYRIDGANIWCENNSITRTGIPVLDIIHPTLTDLSAVPHVNKTFELDAKASDNIQVSKVKAQYRIDDGPWAYGDMSLSGQMYTLTIDIPLSAHNLSYIFTALDKVGLNATVPLRKQNVIDDVAPTIEDASGTPVNGEAFNISYKAVDNIGIYGVRVEYRFDGGPKTFVNGTTSSLQITVPSDSKVLDYKVTCWDASYNIKSIDISKAVEDRTPPTVTMSIGEAKTGLDVPIVVNATDNRGISSMVLLYSFDNSTWTMKTALNFQEPWSVVVTVPPNAVYLYYKGKALDTANNSRELFAKAPVKDIIPPAISVPAGPQPSTGYDFTFIANITDNIGIMGATLEYWFDGGQSTNVSFQSSAIIHIPESARNLNIILVATDGAGNMGSFKGKLAVNDGTPPTLKDMTNGTPEAGKDFVLSVSADDNTGIASVKVSYSIDGKNYTAQMKLAQGLYSTTIKLPTGSKRLNYSFIAVDQSGSEARTQESTMGITGGTTTPPIITPPPIIPTSGGSMLLPLAIIIAVVIGAIVAAVLLIRRKGKGKTPADAIPVSIQKAPPKPPQVPPSGPDAVPYTIEEPPESEL